MAEFKMKIAGYTARVYSLFDSTRDYCKNYLSAEEPDFSVTVTRENLVFEQRELDEEALLEGMRRRVFSDPFLERAAIQRAFADFLLERNILMLHGSTLAMDGRGYLFTAKCGTGKSTHTRLWRQVFGDRAVMVNDDKPFVLVGQDQVWVSGAPWSGKHGLDTNITVPLQGICILERGPENRIRPVQPEDALAMLLHQTHCPAGREEKTLALVKQMTSQVPLWQMACTKDPQAAHIAWEAMHDKQNESEKQL